MYFINTDIRKSIYKAKEKALLDSWFEYMVEAGRLYSLQQWSDASINAGSAMEITTTVLHRSDLNRTSLMEKAVLASIYTFNLLQQQGHVDEAPQIIGRVKRCIITNLSGTEYAADAKSAITVLNRADNYLPYFKENLNLPISAPDLNVFNAHDGETDIERLREKVRKGSEPNNHSLITSWLREESKLHFAKPTLRDRQKLYEKQFYLLLNTVIDELVPRHWRRICLDMIFKPLGGLTQICDNEQSRLRLQKLYEELDSTCQFFKVNLKHY